MSRQVSHGSAGEYQADEHNSLMIQGLALRALTAKGPGSMSGLGSKICKPHSTAKKRKISTSLTHYPPTLSPSAQR